MATAWSEDDDERQQSVDVEDRGEWDAWDVRPGGGSGPVTPASSATGDGTGQPPFSLNREIEAMRALLEQVIRYGSTALADGRDPTDLVLPLTRLVDAIVRAIRAQHVLTGDPEDPMQSAMLQVLMELGLAEEK